MARTRKQSNILNGGQTIKNEFGSVPALTISGDWDTSKDAQIRFENQEGRITFATTPRQEDNVPIPRGHIGFKLDPESHGDPNLGDRKKDYLQFHLESGAGSADYKSATITISPDGHFKHNGNEVVRVLENLNNSDVVEYRELYVTVNGDDEEGDGSFSKPWATLHRGMELLERLRIDRNVIVRFNIGPGEYIFNKPIIISHPDGSRIHFIGDTPFVGGGKIAGFDTGWYYSDRTAPFPLVSSPTYKLSNTAGTLGADRTDIERSKARNESSGDKITNEGILTAANGFKTIFRFNSDTDLGLNGFLAIGGNIGLIDNIAIIGDGKSSNTDDENPLGNYYGATGIAAQGMSLGGREGASASIVVGRNIAIHNFANAGIVANSGVISCVGHRENKHDGITITACGDGAKAIHTSSLYIPSATIQGCENVGITSSSNSYVWAPACDVSGCGNVGFFITVGSSMTADNSRSTGNGYHGVNVSHSSTLFCRNMVSHGNGYFGMHAALTSSILCTGYSIVGNNNHGVYSINASFIAAYFVKNMGYNLQEIIHNGGFGILVNGHASVLSDNTTIKENDFCGVLAANGGLVYARSLIDGEGTGGQRMEISRNGRQASANTFQSSQVVAWMNSLVEVYGSLIGEYPGLNLSDPLLSVAYNSTAFISNDLANQTNLSTADLRLCVKADNGSHLIDENSNLSRISSDWGTRYSPVPNTDGNHNSYCRVIL